MLAGLALVPPDTAFLWDGPDLLWRSVLLVLGPKMVILGRAARTRLGDLPLWPLDPPLHLHDLL